MSNAPETRHLEPEAGRIQPESRGWSRGGGGSGGGKEPGEGGVSEQLPSEVVVGS